MSKTKSISKNGTQNNLPTLTELEEILGSKERTLFYLTWLKHDRNATKAYLELHPEVTDHSARVLGSKMLANISMPLIAQAYGLDHDLYFKKLYDALNAKKWNDFTGEREDDFKTIKPYHDKLGKLIGVEGNEGPSVQVNIANVINEQKQKYDLEE